MNSFPHFSSLAAAFAYYTEAQLATLEEYEDAKRMSNVRLSRQRDIAWGMVQECKLHGVDAPASGTPRLAAMLKDSVF